MQRFCIQQLASYQRMHKYRCIQQCIAICNSVNIKVINIPSFTNAESVFSCGSTLEGFSASDGA